MGVGWQEKKKDNTDEHKMVLVSWYLYLWVFSCHPCDFPIDLSSLEIWKYYTHPTLQHSNTCSKDAFLAYIAKDTFKERDANLSIECKLR